METTVFEKEFTGIVGLIIGTFVFLGTVLWASLILTIVGLVALSPAILIVLLVWTL